MDFMSLLQQAGGERSVEQLGGALGLDSNRVGDLVKAVAPSLLGSISKQAESADGASSLASALQTGNHRKYLEEPELLLSQETTNDGNNILGHLFGSKEVSRQVAAQAAESTGVSADLIKKALPLLAGLAMGMVSKSSDEGRSLDGALPGLVGSLTGDGDFGLDDVINVAKKLF